MHGEFTKLFDEETLAGIKEHGYISYDDVNPAIRKKLPFKTSVRYYSLRNGTSRLRASSSTVRHAVLRFC